MPALEVTDLRQKAVLWEFTGKQDRHGLQVVLAPVEVKVRWVLNDAQVIDPEGNTIAKMGKVIAARDIPNMSIMRLGKLVDLPDTIDNLCQVIKSDTTPDIKNRNTRFEYNLMRFTDKLPPLA